MNYAFTLHVTDYLHHLSEEEPAVVFTHSTHGLAEVEQKTT